MPALETYRSIVEPSDCDVLGHMNVSRYLGICGNGVFALQAAIGLGRAEMLEGRRLSFAVVRAESDFRRELLPGDAVWLETGVMEIGTKSALFRHRLHRSGDDALAFESVFRSVLLDLAARRATEIPDDIRRGLEAYRVSGDN